MNNRYYDININNSFLCGKVSKNSERSFAYEK